MMRTRIIILAGVAMIAASCNFLDENLKGGYSSETFYSSASKAEMALTGVYNGLYDNTLWIFGDVASDDAVKGGNAGDAAEINDIDTFSATTDNGPISVFWQNAYALISNANNVITYVPNVEMEEDLRNRYVAEARFLRAYEYFNLVNIFGEVPVKTKPQNTSEAIHVGLSSVADVYAQIDSDLEEAVKYLPETYSVGAGRVTLGAAYALLAKSKLFQQKYDEALEAIENIPAIYGLEDNYADLFTPGGEDSRECLFAIRYARTTTVSMGNNLNVWFSPSAEGGYYFNAPTQDYVDCFDETTKDGKVDPRLDASIGRDGQPWFNGKTFSESWSEATGYLVKKYNEDMSEEFAKAQSTVPQHIIRYADVLLMKAEALNESGETSLAAVELNKVRSRANLSDTSAATQDAMRDAIRVERRRELGFEFHRFFDVMRYGKEYATSVLGENLKWDDTRYYFPIPGAETDANNAIQ